MRGTVITILREKHSLRITPAYAVNRLTFAKLWQLNKDHPRLRGEQADLRQTLAAQQGSPPLTRGTVTMADADLSYAGITPAYAGNSFPAGTLQP